MRYKFNTCDKSILFHQMFLYLSNFFIEIEANDFNFNNFIKYYKANNHESNQEIYKIFNDIKYFLCFDNANKYVIKQILNKI